MKNYLTKKRTRLREVEFEKIENLKEVMKFADWEIAELLGLYVQRDEKGNVKGSPQYYNYRKSGSVPADRYLGARDALLLSLHQEFKEREQQIMRLFSIT